MASLLNHRQRVVPLIWAVMPCAITSRRMSDRENLDKGNPRRTGSSQARAFTSTTTLGGKAGRATTSGLFIEPGQSEFGEPLSPLTDNLPWQVESRRDNVISETLCSIQND